MAERTARPRDEVFDELARSATAFLREIVNVEFEIASVVVSDPLPGLACMGECGVRIEDVFDEGFRLWLYAAKVLADRRALTGDTVVDRSRWCRLCRDFYRVELISWSEEDFAARWTQERRVDTLAGGSGEMTRSLLWTAAGWWSTGTTPLQARVIRMLSGTFAELHARLRDADEHMKFANKLLVTPRISHGLLMDDERYVSGGLF